jgi:hypothetical protein
MAMMRSNSASSYSASGPTAPMIAALLQRTSIVPNASVAAAT